MPSPHVSVVVITYNQQEFVRQTLLSALDQDYDNLDVIVSDDHSADSTPDIISSLAENYPGRLLPILNSTRAGITGNTNRALSRCQGDFVAFQGGDDLLCPGKIARQAEFMQIRPELALSYHDVDVFDSDSGSTLYRWSQRYGRRTGGVASVVRYGTYMAGTAVMIRRSCMPPNGMDGRIPSASDWLYWIEVLAAGGGGVGYIDDVLARYRRHAKNVTGNWDWKFEDQNLTLALIESRWPEHALLVRQRRSEIFFTQALHHLAGGKRREAWQLGWTAVLSALPSLPWLQLVLREIFFYIRTRGYRDDMLASLFLPR
jgi:glycosyltransferase involved in cell wall biosynthesis